MDILLRVIPKEDTLVPHHRHHINPAVYLRAVTIISNSIINHMDSPHMPKHSLQHHRMDNSPHMGLKLSNLTAHHQIHPSNTMEPLKAPTSHPSSPMELHQTHKLVMVLNQPDNLNTELLSPRTEPPLIPNHRFLHLLLLNNRLTGLLQIHNLLINPSNNRHLEVFSIKTLMAVLHTIINILRPRTMELLHLRAAETCLHHSTNTFKDCTMQSMLVAYTAIVLHLYLWVAIPAKTLHQEVIMHHQVTMADNSDGNLMMTWHANDLDIFLCWLGGLLFI